MLVEGARTAVWRSIGSINTCPQKQTKKRGEFQRVGQTNIFLTKWSRFVLAKAAVEPLKAAIS
jgi:uncharacterized protein YqiB (DUF1249 family)